MLIQYNNLDIVFDLGHARFTTLNIALEHIHRIIPSHSHGRNSYEIHYIASGSGLILVDNAPYPVSAGVFYMAGPHVQHAQISEPDDPMVDYCIYLRSAHLENVPIDPLTSAFEETTFWIGHDRQDMESTLRRLFEELSQPQAGALAAVESLLKLLLIQAVRNYSTTQAGREFPPASPAQARDFIAEESFLYDYAALTLTELARRLGLSSRQTQRFLMENYGKTFQEKRRDARMSTAAMLLEHTNRDIGWIAEAVGYSTREHFSAAFCQVFMESPRDYRKHHFKQEIASRNPSVNLL